MNDHPKRIIGIILLTGRDLLVPQDVRERKGSFYTPKIWVELSQKYIADVFGENWQDEYTIWDCAAGTGNLLAGLTNKYNIWASTLDKQDVDVMLDRIENGANLLKDHVFQFDFLNDNFDKLPDGLKKIIDSPSARRKLIIYINPPYAEHLDKKNTTTSKISVNKAGLKFTKIDEKYSEIYGKKASRELFVQFLIRIYSEIRGSKIANFSTLKNLQSSNFLDFREVFLSRLEKLFLVPANTFDNVKGQFPIGFFIWDTSKKEKFKGMDADVFDSNANFCSNKLIYVPKGIKKSISMNDWIKKFELSETKYLLGYLNCSTQDFLHQNYTGITINKQNSAYKQLPINKNNLIESVIYFAVTFCIKANWLNDRDQFLFPNDGWKTDTEFQNDCLAFTLFHTQNRIVSQDGVNHWIPFREQEIDARDKFASSFMTDFINGKLKRETEKNLFSGKTQANSVTEKRNAKLKFSSAAQAVFNTGRELWKYYHKQPNCHANASYYEIREYFQGRNEKGKMNNTSKDEIYNELIKNLRQQIKQLARKIEPKVYEYGFLR